MTKMCLVCTILTFLGYVICWTRVLLSTHLFFYLINDAKRKIDMEFRKRTRSDIRNIHRVPKECFWIYLPRIGSSDKSAIDLLTSHTQAKINIAVKNLFSSKLINYNIQQEYKSYVFSIWRLKYIANLHR